MLFTQHYSHFIALENLVLKPSDYIHSDNED